jgi:hypothetical protein
MNALRHHAVYWRAAKIPDSLRAITVYQIDVRLSASTFLLSCKRIDRGRRGPGSRAIYLANAYRVRGSVQSLTADTTIVQARAELDRRLIHIVYIITGGIALSLIAMGLPFESLWPLGILLYLVGFSSHLERRLRSGTELPVLDHFFELLDGAMTELGGVTVDGAPSSDGESRDRAHEQPG